MLLLASLVFYAVNDYMMLPVLVAASIINYFLAKSVAKKSRAALVAAIILDAGMLIDFKIAGRLDSSILLPLGLSFYVFKMISYQVDLYKGKISQVNFIKMSTYFTMFPQIISGPISRYDFVTANQMWEKHPISVEFVSDEKDDEELVEKLKSDISQVNQEIANLENATETSVKSEGGEEGSASVIQAPSIGSKLYNVFSHVGDGLKYFAIGLFMKVIIADHLAVLWEELKTIGYESISTPMAWIGAYTYSMNLYFDFWGYSLMAAGVGVMLGFPFIENFIQPYNAVSISDFYRRWHATLGSWFKDYIYIPLGGSRKGGFRTFLNLLVVWLVTGFWHGANFNYIIWAMVIFFIIALEKFLISKCQPLYKIVGRINVLVIIPCTWVIFATHSVRKIGTYFLRLFPVINNGIAVNNKDVFLFVPAYLPYLILGLILVIPGIQTLYRKHKDNVITTIILFAMFWFAVFSLANSAGNPFMYLRF
ncbi:MBOAT family O-acyltransferase [Pseudobutyrivibrio sp. YE44]|uniref:MBOAT family O-acyltransferase n=1 Tax=Pseudobutyrivibrio sp. YE44 TaxID=1520802 RepID=UPI00159F91FE|nr:MBOAT family protein [Pseudobutyrivibrio sp. YE44]